LWPNGWMDQDATWDGGRPQPRRPCGVRWGTTSPTQKGGGSAKFSAHVYCGQTAGWFKMALGMEVGLGPGHIVLDGEPAPLPQKGGRAPRFSAHLLSPNGSMDEDATWYGSRPRPHCIRRGPSSARNEHSSFPSFRPVSMVATVAHLSYC